ncbi:MAG TPA: sigma-70 family RNA polymerase sigma factor [Candidatus Peribacteraceae bacterium]|nr:sigma-70 family RNA polymerase sigma factor [Candidatus Peribacteraceae bacterium]
MESVSLSSGDVLSELPSPRERFGKLLDVPNLRTHNKSDRFKIKSIIEELTAETGLKRNDILDHYGINRILYYDHIDTIQESDLEPVAKEPAQRERREHSNILSRAASEQLAIYERVETMRLSGLYIPEACERAGIYERQYYKIQSRLQELRHKAQKERVQLKEQKKTEIVPKRKRIEQREIRLRMYDATVVLCIATRRKMADISRDLGITYSDLRAWQETQNVKPVFPFKKGPRRALKSAELHLGHEARVRFVHALRQIEFEQLGTAKDIAAALGYREETVEEWSSVVGDIGKKAKEKRRRGSNMLSMDEVSSLSDQLHMDVKSLQPWLRAFKLKDVHTQMSLSARYNAKIHIEPQELMDIWMQIWNDHSTSDMENVLVEYYTPLVEATADKFSQKIPDTVTVEELVVFGKKGLLDAIRKFDISKNTKFETYAPNRILGEMKDGLRSMDWVPRLVRAQRKKMDAAQERFRTMNNREATDEELAEALGMTLEAFHAMKKACAVHEVRSIDATFESRVVNIKESMTLADTLAARPSEGDIERLRDEDREEVLCAILNILQPIEKKIIMGYFFENKTMKEVAIDVGLSESRVSQIINYELLPLLKSRILAHKDKNTTLGYIARAFDRAHQQDEEAA